MDDQTISILLVDSQVASLFTLKHILAPLSVNLVEAESATQALSMLGKFDVALAIVELVLDDKSGIELLKQMKSKEFTKNVPVMLLSNTSIDERTQRSGYSAGAVDMIAQPLSPPVLLNKCRIFIDLFKLRKKLQKTIFDLGTYAGKLEQANHKLQLEIKHHKKTKEGKQRLEDLLQQNSRLHSIGTLAGGIAHDFNNILYAVLGYADLAIRQENLSPVIKDYLEKITLAGERGKTLVGSVLSFSRQAPLTFSEVNLDELIQETVTLLRPTIPAHVNFLVTEPIPKGSVWGDRARLEQVLLNLVNNAVDAIGSDENGQISVTLKDEDTTPEFFAAHPNLKEGLNYYRIDVTDNGSGMDPETARRAFDPFYTTKDVGEGTGLGLASAYGIVNEHLGEIEIQTDPGFGTTLIIYIPRYASYE